ncbi:unnamed protein product [Prunus armeniaca]|uniref:Uncharacterized protein n=1 Tax=Prunus armeniaca TaxID=36596 RepID=A0A6J5TS16_PRUAR|nr:unnamed protein product [Prunus armeniaca]CAB4293666.1 unnamed protein product [Prunus armeniaca]
MSRLQSLTRSTPSIHQRFSIRHLSTAPQPSSSSLSSLITASSYSKPHQNPSYGSFLKWISGFAMGSGLGLLYWSSPDSVLTFADWSTVVPGETLEDQPSSSLFQKLSLPEITARFLFGGKSFLLTSSISMLIEERSSSTMRNALGCEVRLRSA